MKESENFKVDQADLDAIEVVDLSDVSEEVSKELTDAQMSKMRPKNIPYKKVYNSEGKLANPIEAGNLYLNPFLNRRGMKTLVKKATKHPKNNKKGIRLIVTPFAKGKFVKTEVVKQRIVPNYIPIFDNELEHTGWEFKEANTLIHNQIKL